MRVDACVSTPSPDTYQIRTRYVSFGKGSLLRNEPQYPTEGYVQVAMPPVANPNPDRARRAASVAPAAEAKVDSGAAIERGGGPAADGVNWGAGMNVLSSVGAVLGAMCLMCLLEIR